jgi:hypothetical protein
VLEPTKRELIGFHTKFNTCKGFAIKCENIRGSLFPIIFGAISPKIKMREVITTTCKKEKRIGKASALKIVEEI